MSFMPFMVNLPDILANILWFRQFPLNSRNPPPLGENLPTAFILLLLLALSLIILLTLVLIQRRRSRRLKKSPKP